MNVQHILDRILHNVDRDAYLTPVDHVDSRFKEALELVGRGLADPDTDASTCRALARGLYAEGRLDKVHLHSALHVIAAHPSVGDYVEAARQVAEQEMAAFEVGGTNLESNLASVDRHRGVLAFVQGRYGAALDYFSRALERERSVENLGNILCALIRLGEADHADALVAQVRDVFPKSFVSQLQRRIDTDPDLINLRS
jgi:tetratricopeptide (TPR) repeat protein